LLRPAGGCCLLSCYSLMIWVNDRGQLRWVVQTWHYLIRWPKPCKDDRGQLRWVVQTWHYLTRWPEPCKDALHVAVNPEVSLHKIPYVQMC
jgi:hypothetical protein